MSVEVVAAPGIVIPTYKRLNSILDILGGTKTLLLPMKEFRGVTFDPYGSSYAGPRTTANDENGVIGIQNEMAPQPLVGGINAIYFDRNGNNHIVAGNHDMFSHTDGADDDSEFSLGAWVQLFTAVGAVTTIIAKYGSTANLEEYDFRFDASGNLVLELHDASESASETATGAGDVLSSWTWHFVVATYDGDQDDPEVHLYKDSVDTLAAGTTVESGSYVGMENTGSVFMIGARDATGTPTQEHLGLMALPFICGKKLTQSDVNDLYGIGQEMVGLV